MTRYYVDISDDLLEGEYAITWPPGFRLVERFGPRDLFVQRWLVEDDQAPADFEGHLVSVSFRWDREEDASGVTVILTRDKLALRY